METLVYKEKHNIRVNFNDLEKSSIVINDVTEVITTPEVIIYSAEDASLTVPFHHILYVVAHKGETE